MQNFEQLVTNVTHFLAIALIFGSVLYGERKYFKKGRPVFYQFILLGLLCKMMVTVYDIITYMFFVSAWSGFTLPVLGNLGFALFFSGAMVEIFQQLEGKGVSCSFTKGFGLPSKLLALIPVAAEMIIFYVITKVDPVRQDVVWLSINVVFQIIPSYLASLLLFRKDDGSGYIRSLRPCCLGMIVVQLTFLYFYYSAFVFGLTYCIACILFSLSAVFLTAGLERGSRKWI